MEDVPQVRPADEGANTYQHILREVPNLSLPHLRQLGLDAACGLAPAISATNTPAMVYGRAALTHFGADTFFGHQEIMNTRPSKAFVLLHYTAKSSACMVILLCLQKCTASSKLSAVLRGSRASRRPKFANRVRRFTAPLSWCLCAANQDCTAFIARATSFEQSNASLSPYPASSHSSAKIYRSSARLSVAIRRLYS